jgi:hypothetical protein
VNNLGRRIERLEGKLGLKRTPRHVLITNVDATGDKAGEFLPGLYVDVWGEPLTPEELEELKEKYRQRENTDEQFPPES